jgi:hypothetical protein
MATIGISEVNRLLAIVINVVRSNENMVATHPLSLWDNELDKQASHLMHDKSNQPDTQADSTDNARDRDKGVKQVGSNGYQAG